MASGSVQVSAIVPSAPASATAAASSGTAAGPIGACTIGCSIRNSSQSRVRTASAYAPEPGLRRPGRLGRGLGLREGALDIVRERALVREQRSGVLAGLLEQR